MTPKETVKYILDRCREDGDCMLWQLALSSGTPAMRLAGKSVQVRRVLMAAQGHDMAGKCATYTCGNSRCMVHTEAITRAELQARNGRLYQNDPVRQRKIAMAARASARAKLTMEIVQEMRSSGMSTREAAKRYGVTQSTAAQAMRGDNWREYSSPWRGL